MAEKVGNWFAHGIKLSSDLFLVCKSTGECIRILQIKSRLSHPNPENDLTAPICTIGSYSYSIHTGKSIPSTYMENTFIGNKTVDFNHCSQRELSYLMKYNIFKFQIYVRYVNNIVYNMYASFRVVQNK